MEETLEQLLSDVAAVEGVVKFEVWRDNPEGNDDDTDRDHGLGTVGRVLPRCGGKCQAIERKLGSPCRSRPFWSGTFRTGLTAS
jgi:hypothetical protein